MNKSIYNKYKETSLDITMKDESREARKHLPWFSYSLPKMEGRKNKKKKSKIKERRNKREERRQEKIYQKIFRKI